MVVYQNFWDWRDHFCQDNEDCTIEEAVYYTIYGDLGDAVAQMADEIDTYVKNTLQLEWIRPNLIEIRPGYRKNLQRHLEQLGRTNEETKKIAKIYQTYSNKTQQAAALYEKTLEGYYIALKLREVHKERNEIPNFSKILGNYSFPGSDFGLVLTDDPPEILFKSQGRPWEGESCERFAGEYCSGYMSDIEHGNLIAFVIDRDGFPIARKMLRWAYGPNKELALNLEKWWYFNSADKEQELYDMADDKLTEIIHENGYYVPTSITPYEYVGYSDTAGQGYTRIDYIGPPKIRIDPEKHYLMYYPPIENGKINYNQVDLVDANRINAAQIQYLLLNGFTWGDLREAAFYYQNYLHYKNIGDVKESDNQSDLEQLLDELFPFKLDMPMKLQDGEYVLDEENIYYKPSSMNEDSLFHEQALKLMKAFRLDFEDYKLYLALFKQYYLKHMRQNAEAGLYCEGIFSRLSWIGNLSGGNIFYDVTRKCLVSMEDSIYQQEIVDGLIHTRLSTFLEIRNDLD